MYRKILMICMISMIILIPKVSFSSGINNPNNIIQNNESNYNGTNNGLPLYMEQKKSGLLEFLSVLVDMFSLYNGYKDMQTSERIYNANPTQENLNNMLLDSSSYYYDLNQSYQKYNNTNK